MESSRSRLRVVGMKRVVAALVAVFMVTGCASNTIRNDDGEVITAGDWSVFDLRPGDCIGDSPSDGRDMVPLVPCDEPHGVEIFSLVRAAGTVYPGGEALAALADQSCLAALTDLVDSIPEDVAWSYLIPSEQTWTNQDDQVIVCLLILPSGQGVGSIVAGTLNWETAR